MPYDAPLLPTVNAGLNALAFVLLLGGFAAIRRGRVTVHKRFMLGAFTASALFLVSYLIYHYTRVHTVFPGTGAVRYGYYAILVSHIVLAVALVPLVLVTLAHALRERFAAHRRLARWTLPVWLYVSVTGVVVYWMLYVLYGAA